MFPRFSPRCQFKLKLPLPDRSAWVRQCEALDVNPPRAIHYMIDAEHDIHPRAELNGSR
jgi:hypothetical protein